MNLIGQPNKLIVMKKINDLLSIKSMKIITFTYVIICHENTYKNAMKYWLENEEWFDGVGALTKEVLSYKIMTVRKRNDDRMMSPVCFVKNGESGTDICSTK